MLTPREKEILQCCFDFDDDRQAVAEALGIARSTVVSHLQHGIYPKLMVSNFPGAVRVALWKGWIDVEHSVRSHPPLLAQNV